MARPRLPPEDEIALFRRRVADDRIHPVVAHNSYLINLAAAAPALREQSIAALGEELRSRRGAGAATGSSCTRAPTRPAPKPSGLRLIADGLAELLRARPARRR